MHFTFNVCIYFYFEVFLATPGPSWWNTICAILFIRLTRLKPRDPMGTRGPLFDQGQAVNCSGLIEVLKAPPPTKYLKPWGTLHSWTWKEFKWTIYHCNLAHTSLTVCPIDLSWIVLHEHLWSVHVNVEYKPLQRLYTQCNMRTRVLARDLEDPACPWNPAGDHGTVILSTWPNSPGCCELALSSMKERWSINKTTKYKWFGNLL